MNVKKKQTECTKGHYTGRVIQIRSDGGLVYEYVCQAEKTVTITVPQADPQAVNARYAAGIKPGMFVSIVEDVVTVAYSKAASCRRWSPGSRSSRAYSSGSPGSLPRSEARRAARSGSRRSSRQAWASSSREPRWRPVDSSR